MRVKAEKKKQEKNTSYSQTHLFLHMHTYYDTQLQLRETVPLCIHFFKHFLYQFFFFSPLSLSLFPPSPLPPALSLSLLPGGVYACV